MGAVLSVFMIVLFPMYQASIYNQVRAQEQALAYTRDLVDEVIDSRRLSESTLEDFYLKLGSTTANLSARITKEVRVVNPDPLTPSKTYTAYLASEDIYTYEQGDRIVVEVFQVGDSLMERIAKTFLNLHLGKISFSLVGRVR